MCQQALQGAPFATFSRGTLIFFSVVQVVGLKWVLQHLQNSGFVEVPPWVPFIDRSNCGLYKPLEYIVTSRKVITPDGTFPAAIHVKGGRVMEVKPVNGAASRANLTHAALLTFGLKHILDYGDLVVAPGLIDTHVHMDQPGRTNWEGMETATRAAAVGGITTVIDMPLNNEPTTTSSRLVEQKIWASWGELMVDTGFWGGIVPDNAGHHTTLQSMVDAGVLGFKSFMIPSGINDFPNVSEEDIRKALPFLKRAGVPYYVHAELQLEDSSPGECSGDEADPTQHATWLASRPPKMEYEAIKLLIKLLDEDKTPAEPGFTLHVAHLANADALPMIEAAKKKGLPITVETCTHYLTFSAESVPEGATWFKCAPPLRSKSNQDKLWAAVKAEKIDGVASDHSPCPPDMKEIESGNFMKAWGGIAGLQYGLPGTWNGMRKRGMKPEDLTRLWSTHAAKLAGMQHRKGALAAGMDADIVVWNPDGLADTSLEHLKQRWNVTPYEDLGLYGQVYATFVRGHLVYTLADDVSKSVCGKTVLKQHL